jgi:hypothetical protein
MCCAGAADVLLDTANAAVAAADQQVARLLTYQGPDMLEVCSSLAAPPRHLQLVAKACDVAAEHTSAAVHQLNELDMMLCQQQQQGRQAGDALLLAALRAVAAADSLGSHLCSPAVLQGCPLDELVGCAGAAAKALTAVEMAVTAGATEADVAGIHAEATVSVVQAVHSASRRWQKAKKRMKAQQQQQDLQEQQQQQQQPDLQQSLATAPPPPPLQGEEQLQQQLPLEQNLQPRPHPQQRPAEASGRCAAAKIPQAAAARAGATAGGKHGRNKAAAAALAGVLAAAMQAQGSKHACRAQQQEAGVEVAAAATEPAPPSVIGTGQSSGLEVGAQTAAGPTAAGAIVAGGGKKGRKRPPTGEDATVQRPPNALPAAKRPKLQPAMGAAAMLAADAPAGSKPRLVPGVVAPLVGQQRAQGKAAGSAAMRVPCHEEGCPRERTRRRRKKQKRQDGPSAVTAGLAAATLPSAAGAVAPAGNSASAVALASKKFKKSSRVQS